MRTASVFVDDQDTGILTELEFGKRFRFQYKEGYSGFPVSVTMPVSHSVYEFDSFPYFFDGLLPEGYQLEGLLKFGKIDRNDLFSQLMAVGNDLIGNVSVIETKS